MLNAVSIRHQSLPVQRLPQFPGKVSPARGGGDAVTIPGQQGGSLTAALSQSCSTKPILVKGTSAAVCGVLVGASLSHRGPPKTLRGCEAANTKACGS